MAQVAKHLCRGGSNVDLTGADPESLHQCARVPERPLAGREPRHRVREDVRSRESETVDGPGADRQRMRGVKAAGDADHDLVDLRGAQARLEALNLDVEDLLAALVPARWIGRDVRESLYPAPQSDERRVAEP